MEHTGVKWIIKDSSGNHKVHFHNAGVGGSSPPITTIFQMPLFRGIFFAHLDLPIF